MEPVGDHDVRGVDGRQELPEARGRPRNVPVDARVDRHAVTACGLKLPLPQGVDRGGVGLSASAMSWFVIAMQVGMWFGYVSFGYIADAIGRKRTYVLFVLAASILLPIYGNSREPMLLLFLGPFVAFFGTGYYSGFGAVTAELYPTRIRATAQGFTYNLGRIASAAAPFTVGSLHDAYRCSATSRPRAGRMADHQLDKERLQRIRSGEEESREGQQRFFGVKA